MINLKNVCLAALLSASAVTATAGGLLTNTNQNIAFNRMMSREASIGIDGVYFNPAGVAFMKDGHHLSINLQTAWQTRTIENDYALFNYNVKNPTTPRKFEGKAFAPVIPSFQYAYNKNRWSFQANFALAGGGGKCKFDNGLGSFEKVVANIGFLGNSLAPYLNGILPVNPNIANPATGTMGGYGYTYDSFMRGRQYYYGLSVGAAYRINDHLSVFGGVRGVYATCNYYGYVKNIAFVGNNGAKLPLSTMVDRNDPESSDIELNTDQTGYGFTPIIGIDYKTGRWNFSAKYELKTRIRLNNKSVNQAPSIGNLPDNLRNAYIANGVPEAAADQILSNPAIQGAMSSLKQQFDSRLGEAIGEFEDGKSLSGDIPALLTLGAGYNPIDPLHINVGFHWFDDRHATAHNGHNRQLDHGTIEWNAGIEYDINKRFTVSAGWQNTNYGLTDEYMDDKSFVVSSNSVAVGGVVRLSKRMKLNVAYFHTFYGHKKVEEQVDLGTAKINYNSDYTRNNNVFAVGLDVDF